MASVVLLTVLGCAPPAPDGPLQAPLATERPPDEIASSLDGWVPSAMRDASVPGLVVVVIRDGELIAERAYGVSRSTGREPLTPDAVFEVASISKPIAAFTALSLVADGRLELDEPVADLVDPPFLPDQLGTRGAPITLRDLLTHQSGLRNEPSAEPSFGADPGERFGYSGQGFSYLGRVVESVTGAPYSAAARERVFVPLQMATSGFGDDPQLAGQTVPAHVSATMPWIASALIAGVVFVPLFLVWWLWRRLVHDRTRAPRLRWFVVAALACGAIAPLPLLGMPTGGVFALSSAVGLSLAAAGVISMAKGMSRLGSVAGLARVGAGLASLALVGWALHTRPPIPLDLEPRGHYEASGLLTTAPDLARFLDAVMVGTALDPELHEAMISSQVEVSEHVDWGLGIGLQHGESTRSVWHWGVNFPGHQALIVGFPEERLGVVVLTNGGPMLRGGARFLGLELAREVAFRAIGGEQFGYWDELP